jgi:hypothetical protein
MKPLHDVIPFRKDHPVSGFVTELLGFTAPFMLPGISLAKGMSVGMKAASKVPLARRIVKAAGEAAEADRVVLARTLQATAEVGALETARLGAAGLAELSGEEGAFKHTAIGAAIDIPFIAGATAGLSALGRAKIEPRVREMRGHIEENWPAISVAESAEGARQVLRWDPQGSMQEHLRYVNELLRRPPEALHGLHGDLLTFRNGLIRDVRRQNPWRGTAAVQKLVGENGARRASELTSFFRAGRKGSVSSRTLTVHDPKSPKTDPFGVATQVELDDITSAMGIIPEVEGHMQFPRVLTATTDKGASTLVKSLNRNFGPLGRPGFGQYIAREQDGVFVAAKRIRGARGVVPAQGDQYLLFKTSRPELFFPEMAKFGRDMLKTGSLMREAYLLTIPQSLKNIEPITRARAINQQLSAESLIKVGAPVKATEEFVPGMMGNFREELVRSGRMFREAAKHYTAPSSHIGSESIRASQLRNKILTMYRTTLAKSNVLFFGERASRTSKTLVGTIFERVHSAPGSVDEAFTLAHRNKVAWDQANLAVARGMTAEQIAEAGFEPEARNLLKKLHELDMFQRKEVRAVEEWAPGGDVPFEPLEFHYLASRRWRGKHRVPIFESIADPATGKPIEGNLVGYGSGRDRAAAIARAEAIAADLAEVEGKRVIVSPRKAFTSGREHDLVIQKELTKIGELPTMVLDSELRLIEGRSPIRFKPRAGIKGYIENFTEKEFRDLVKGNIVETQNYMSKRLVMQEFAEDWHKLAQEFPGAWVDLHRYNVRAAGERLSRGLAREIENAIDTVLAPVLGKNSATNIATAVNNAIYHLTLGAGDIGFGALNTASFIQTALPEISWLLTAPPSEIARYYAPNLVLGRDNIPRTFWSLKPTSIATQALKDIIRPDAEARAFWERGVKELVIGQNFAEVVLGQRSRSAVRFKQLLEGEAGFVEYLGELSSYIPRHSEMMVRGYSMMMGRIVGKDFYGLTGDRLFRFASSFADRTNYLYTTADRPLFTTGAFGQLAGLFKTWSINYLMNFMNYAGEAAARKNFAPMLWAMTGTAALGGLAAVPGYGIANYFSRMATDKPIVEHLYKGMGYGDGGFDTVIDAIQYGVPVFGGVTLQSRAEVPGSDFVRNVNQLTSIMALERAMSLGDSIGDAVAQWQDTGVEPWRSPGMRQRFVRDLMPRTIWRAAAMTEKNGYKSLRNNGLVVTDLTVPERVAHTFGLTSLSIQKMYDMRSQLRFEEDEARRVNSNYGRLMAEAEDARDYGRSMQLLRMAFEDHAEIDSVLRSKDANLMKMRVPAIHRQFDDIRAITLERALMGRNQLY